MATLVIGILAMWTALSMDFGTDRFAALWTLFGVGFGVALLACILAAVNRSWLGRIPLLLVGILALWAGLLLGSDGYFRVWQAMPNPPDEAFSDSGPSFLLIVGWIPGTIGIIILFLPCLLAAEVIRLVRRHGDPPSVDRSAPPTSASNST
ncbi:MAG: hypothetical protein GY895_10730 [Phycisphaera sp.]|nr:hypothetical protein [Phycisphaera sp.]